MSQNRTVRVAAVQMSPVLDAPGGTVEKVLDAVAAAGRDGLDLVVFPETLVPWYPYFAFVHPPAATGAEHLRLYAEAVAIPGPVCDAVSAAARRAGAVVVLGVTERDGGTLYNAQLVFDADGRLVLHRRKITPTFHERMVWGQGDGSGLCVVDTAVGRLGALACWEHYNPLARYSLMAQGEEIHAAQFPGSMVGQIFADQMEVTIRHHALEAACFVVNATGWLTDDQVAAVTPDDRMRKALRGGCCTAIVSPEGVHLAPPLREGEGRLVAELDMALVTKRKRMMDSVGHYARPELLSLNLDNRRARPLHAAVPFDPSALGAPADARPADDRPAAGRPAPADRAADQRAPVLRGAPA